MIPQDMTDDELISMALDQWCNHIETGNIGLSATDIANQPYPKKGNFGYTQQERDLIKMKDKASKTSRDQMRLILRLQDLKDKFATD